MLNITYQLVNNSQMAFAVFGQNKIDLVVEMGLGACMGEWWHVAQALSEQHTVLLYERLGCGNSQKSQAERTPENIARELHALLSALPHQDRITLLAHSQGGLYAQQFARLYPDLVQKLVLLDPLSPEDDRFRKELTKHEYKKSGVDKRSGLYLNLVLAKLHLGAVIKKWMRNAPPFYYYPYFSADATGYILDQFTKPGVYTTALAEYNYAHREDVLVALKQRKGFPAIPLRLITHASARSIQEIQEFGGLEKKEAAKVQALWQDVMQLYLSFTPDSKLYKAKQSSHYIHLTDQDLIKKAIAE